MANTPNLDLVKPAGTDHALVSVINSNSDKIDAGYGSVSEQIAKYGNKAGTRIASGSDLDNYTTAGNYYILNAQDASGIDHTPSTGSGRLEVVETNGAERFRQTFYANSATSATYIRTYSSSGWSDWRLLAFGDKQDVSSYFTFASGWGGTINAYERAGIVSLYVTIDTMPTLTADTVYANVITKTNALVGSPVNVLVLGTRNSTWNKGGPIYTAMLTSGNSGGVSIATPETLGSGNIRFTMTYVNNAN